MAHRNWLTAAAACAAIAVIVATSAYFCSQRPASADSRAMVLPADPTPLVAVTKGGERSFSIEVADTSAEREAGLMFRENMADDHGMLFVFDGERDVSFWMKNTPMPLDLIFVGQDGKIRAIAKGVRRTTSRLGGSLEPFAELRVALARGRTFDVVTEVHVGHAWLQLRDRLESTATA